MDFKIDIDYIERAASALRDLCDQLERLQELVPHEKKPVENVIKVKRNAGFNQRRSIALSKTKDERLLQVLKANPHLANFGEWVEEEYHIDYDSSLKSYIRKNKNLSIRNCIENYLNEA